MGRTTRKSGQPGTTGKLRFINRTRKRLVHRWRPSKTALASVREEYARTRRQKRGNAEALNKYIKASVASVKRLMKVRRIPKNRFTRNMYNTRSRHRCQQAVINGVRQFASVYLGSEIRKEDKPAIRECIDRQLDIIEGIDSVPTMFDMGYIFVIGTRNDESNNDSDNNSNSKSKDVQIYFQPVLSSLELGSVHAILVMRAGITKVYAAGEMRKQGRHVDYNMLSGTFMFGFKYELEAIHMTDTIFGALLDHDMTVKHDKSGDSLIGRDVHEGELIHAKRCGYTVELFSDRNRCLLDYRYQDAKKKGRAKDFLNVRKNISYENKVRLLANNVNPDERLYEPNAYF